MNNQKYDYRRMAFYELWISCLNKPEDAEQVARMKAVVAEHNEAVGL
jgi:hypothetical protein